jgi:hypothetical protein
MDQLHDFAQLCGWRWFHPFDSRRSEPGWPDIVLCRPPRLILAELKSDSGKLSPAQARWLDLFTRCPGVEVYLWRPRDWDQIEVVLG